eukprot:5245443-Alexandrium_andersonii.AAC.1
MEEAQAELAKARFKRERAARHAEEAQTLLDKAKDMEVYAQKQLGALRAQAKFKAASPMPPTAPSSPPAPLPPTGQQVATGIMNYLSEKARCDANGAVAMGSKDIQEM